MASRALLTQKPSQETTAAGPAKTRVSSGPEPLQGGAALPAGSTFSFGNMPIFSRSEVRLSRRGGTRAASGLKIGGANEPREREADEVAERVLRMPDRVAVKASAGEGVVRRKCESCSEEEEKKRREEESGAKVSRKTAPGKASLDGAPAPGIVQDVLRMPGQPLDAASRAFFEPRFGHDFGKVRIHTGSRAEESAQAVRARAYTAGEDIVFGVGEHRPNDHEGRKLLAHELAHVVQPSLAFPSLFRAPLMYDPTAFTIPLPRQPFTLDDAKKLVENKKTATPPDLKSGAVKGAAAGSTEEIFLWYILAEVAQADRKGTEVDIVTAIGWPPSAGGTAPVGKVTVDIDSDGNGVAELISAGPVAAPTAFAKPADAIAALKSTYGIKSVTDDDASWSPSELDKMAGAFALLPPSDRAALNGVDLLRVATISGGENCGEFGSSQSVSDTTVTSEATLKIADCAFGHEEQSFVGGKAVQSPASYMTIVHEVGHAIATKAARDTGVARLEAIAKSNEAIEASNQAIDETNSLIDEFNVLVNETNSLIDGVNKAVASRDDDAIRTARGALAAKRKELAAKKKEVDAAKKVQSAKKTAVDAAKSTIKVKKAAEQAAAAPLATFQAAAAAKKASAAARLGAAQSAVKGFSQQDADDSATYRKAVDDAAKAITDYATSAAKEDADLDTLDSTAQGAIDDRNSAREDLSKANASNAALGKFEAVDKAQDAWLDAEKALGHARQRSAREQRFADFVTAHKITPFTKYAKDNWPLKPGEFYAEAYSLWRTDPEYLKANSRALFDWFQAGRYK